jgi:hypothetical protein
MINMANKLSREEVAAKWLTPEMRHAAKVYVKALECGFSPYFALAFALRELDQAKPSRKERK